jgi:hypothetical protein
MLDLRALGRRAALAALLCAPCHVRAQSADEQAYRQTTDEAVREFDAGHWEEARALFKRAHEISPSARTLRGMGMAAFEMRMYVQAIRELDASLREPRKPLDADLRTQVQQLIAKARGFVGHVKLVLEPAEAKPLIDGREPESEPDGSVFLDVGTHVISATAEGHKPTNLRLRVEGGMDQAVRVALEPLLAVQPMVPALDALQSAPPPQPSVVSAAVQKPSGRPPARGDFGTSAWIALAGAGGFGIASGVFWLVGEGQYKDLKDPKTGCSPNCSEQQISDSGVKTSDLLTDVFLGLAAVSGLASGVLFAIDAGRSGEHDALAREQPSSAVSLSLHVAPSGAALKGAF